MASKMTCMAVHVAFMTIFLIAISVISDDTTPIPADKQQVKSWFHDNVKPYRERRATIDPELVTAEDGAKVIKVKKDGSGNFKTISDAINSIPTGNTKRVIVFIGGGVYTEKIKIDRAKPFVTLYGSPKSKPTLIFSGTALQYGTVDSATLIVESDYFTAANLNIVNSSPRPDGIRKGAQAAALRISGDKASFYNCKIIGFQDTLCDDKGRHFFKDCYIRGTVDFVFGSGKSLYLHTQLRVIGDGGMITAQARKSDSEDNGYSFVQCRITGTGSGTVLGRAWMPSPMVVFAYTNMSSILNPLGWSDDFHPERDNAVFYGEYKNSGPGGNPAGRVKFSKQLSDAQVQPFITLSFIEGSKWLLPPP